MVTGVGFDVFIIFKNILEFLGFLPSRKYFEFETSTLAGTISPLVVNFSLLSFEAK